MVGGTALPVAVIFFRRECTGSVSTAVHRIFCGRERRHGVCGGALRPLRGGGLLPGTVFDQPRRRPRQEDEAGD